MINQLKHSVRFFRTFQWAMMVALCATFSQAAFSQTIPYTLDLSADPFADGWSQFSVTGDQTWGYNASFDNVSMSAFSGGCLGNEDWLISPAFDLSQQSDELLEFDVQRGFPGDNDLEVLYSTDYSGTGDPNAATWTSITTITNTYFNDNSIPNNTSETFGAFTDLQAVTGTAGYVAFKFDYQTGGCATWRLAAFSVLSASSPTMVPSVDELSGLSYEVGSGPSAAQSYTLTASNLTGSGNVLVSAPANFEVSLNNISWSNSVNVAYSGGTLNSQPVTIYTRLNAGLADATYSGIITHSGGGASAEVNISGVVSIGGQYLVNFEGASETKPAYASGNVILNGLEWNMTNALIGTDAADFKNGLRSARLRGYGDTEISMLEDKTGGLGTLSFEYAAYGSDPQVPYVAEYSSDSGVSWIQIGSEFTASTTPASFSENVGVANDVRIRIRTVGETGTSNQRMNMDDIVLTDFDGSTCTANGGTLSSDATRSYCVNTGTPQSINVTVTGASGTNQRWGLVNSSGTVVDSRGTNSLFNLDSYPAGDYSIQYIRYENDVNIASVNQASDIQTLEGCFDLASNPINLKLRNVPNGGLLTATSPTTVCENAGAATGVSVALTGAVGENSIFALVSLPSGTVLDAQPGTVFNLNGYAPGQYRIIHLSYQDGVSLNGVVNGSDLEGCFDLSNQVSVTIQNCSAVELTSAPNPTSGLSNVTFTVPNENLTTVEVFDMNGRRVASLFNQTALANAEYRLEFDGAGLPNGVYIYRLTTNDKVVIEKFMIAK